MKYKRGLMILERFQSGYKVMGKVCKRFPGLKRNVLAGLVEIYLDEMNQGYNFELRQNHDLYLGYVKDVRAPRLELNEQGDAVVRAFIFAYRNRLDKVINIRKREDSE